MNSNLEIPIRTSGRLHGEVFTSQNVVLYLLDEVGYIAEHNLSEISILEPSAGKGDIALEIIERLFRSSVLHCFDFAQAFMQNVRFVEYNPLNYNVLCLKIKNLLSSFKLNSAINLESIIICSDYLSLQIKKRFDCVVANPPYIRHELLSPTQKTSFRKEFRTFTHRADLYIPFFEKSLRLLSPKGTLSFICSNRWIYNQYGQELRGLIASKFQLKKLLNIERTSPFDENVIAYPAIVTITKSAQARTIQFLDYQEKEIDFTTLKFQEKESPNSHSWEHLFVNFELGSDSLMGICEQGFSIGIGIATGADSIFILKAEQRNDVEQSCLTPIIMTQDLKHESIHWSGHYLVNPFQGEGLRNLEHFPRLLAYFETHKTKLQGRYIAQKAPLHWYKTIDKVKPDLQSKTKLLLPDISGMKYFHIDEGQYYPHHNIYYITSDSNQKQDLVILACILMSDFARDQVSKIGIKMNGGFPRYQSQLLRKLKIPIVSSFSASDRSSLSMAYQTRDYKLINDTIGKYTSDLTARH